MIKLNSLIYLFYYLLLWVVLPFTGAGAQVIASEFSSTDYTSITNGYSNVADFQQCVNPDWNSISKDSQQSLVSGTGHWPVIFSSVFKPSFIVLGEEILDSIFSNAPILGALTVVKIIFPSHYFW